MNTDRRRQILDRDLRAALDVPEAAGPGVVDYLMAELARLKQPATVPGRVLQKGPPL